MLEHKKLPSFLFLLILTILLKSSFGGVTLTLSNPVVNQYSLYSFELIPTSSWSQIGQISISFDLPSIVVANNTNITTCYEATTSVGLGCYAYSSSQFRFTWTAAKNSSIQPDVNLGSIMVVAATLLNPPYVTNFNVDFKYYKSDGSLFDSGSTTYRRLTNDSLTACSITFSPDYAISSTTATVSLRTKNAIPNSGSFMLTVNGYTISDTVTTVDALSNSSILTTTKPTYFSSNQMYFFSNFFKTSISAGSNITFAISSILSPPTTSTTSFSWTLTTLYTTSTSNTIDSRICSIDVNEYPLDVALSLNTSTFMVGTSVRATFIYVTPTLLNFATDNFNFVVQDASTTYLNAIAAFSTGSGSNFEGQNTPLIIGNMTNGVLIPSNVNTDTYAANATISFRGSGLILRSLINSGTRTIQLRVLKSGVTYANAIKTVTVVPNVFSSCTIIPTPTRVSVTAVYNFTFTITNPLLSGAALKITLPSDLFIANGACTATVTRSATASSGIVCTATLNTVVFITNMISASVSSGTIFTVTVSNIINPISVKTTGTFLIETFYNSTQLSNAVDYNTGLATQTITPTTAPITIGNFLMSGTNKVNLQNAIYTITYKVTTRFKANGFVTLTLPSEMTLSSGYTCTMIVTSTSNISSSSQNLPTTAAVSGSSNIITFNFSSVSTVTTDQPAGTIFTITITSIKNYYSFKPIYPLLKVYASDGSSIEQSGSTDVQLINTVQDTSLSVSMSTTTRINGNPTSLAFSITNPSNLASGDALTVELQNTNNINNQMYYSTSPTCGGSTTACTIDGTNSRLLTALTSTAITSATAFTMTITNVILARSFEVPGKIYFKTYQKINTTLYIISSITFNTVANTQKNSIKTVTLSIDNGSGLIPSKLNQPQKFSLTITPTNNFQSGDVIIIKVPSQYTFIISTVSIANGSDLNTLPGSFCTNSNLFCSNNLNSGYQIKVQEKITGNVFSNITSITVIVSNGTYVSPKDWDTYDSQNFIVNTFTSTGKDIDSSELGNTTNAKFYLACPVKANRCETCISNGTCQSCYSFGTGFDTTQTYGAYYYLTSTGVCVQSCGSNFYNSSNRCIQCTSPCSTCSGSSSFCLTCNSSTYFFNNTCNATCPTKYFADSNGNVCSLCLTSCQTCSVISSNCTSCLNNYLLSGNCVSSSSCLSTQFADATTWTCASCSASCTICTVNSTNCGACATGYILDTSLSSGLPGACTNKCPTGTANDTTNILGSGVGCKCNYTICQTCNGTVNNCTSCNGTFLQNNTCVSSCPSGFFNTSSVCSSCSSNCQSCTSSTVCTNCSSSYVLSPTNTCAISCTTYYSIVTQSNGIKICLFCGTGCTNCTVSTVCTTCESSYIFQKDTNANTVKCVIGCESGYFLYSGSCSNTCPSTTTANSVSRQCVVNPSNTTTTVLTTTLASRFIPFPFIISLGVLTVATLISRLGLSSTLVQPALCAFGGLVQVLSWFVFVIVEGTEATEASPAGMAIAAIALLLNFILNIIGIIFFKKYVFPDEKMQAQLKKLRDKSKTGVCMTYTCIVFSVLFSHKWIQILFSNLYESAFFTYKVSDKTKLVPLNYIRYFSIIPSLCAIIGAGIGNYTVQVYSLNSIVFIQSIDLIIVTIFSTILSFVVTVRKAEDYEKNIADKKEDLASELDNQMMGENVYHLEQQQKDYNKSAKYRHRSTLVSNDLKQDPVSRRNANKVNPIGQLNLTNAPLGGDKDDEDNRINLNGFSQAGSNIIKRLGPGSEVDLDHINIIQDSGESSLPMVRKGKNKQKDPKISDRTRKNINVDLDPQKERIKDNIQNKLTQEQIKRTKVVKDVDKIDTSAIPSQDINKQGSENAIKQLGRNELKKQKLQLILNAGQDGLESIPQKDRKKAGQMKNAMKILNAKKVQIGQYLEYLDIIQEEDEDKNSDDYNLSKRNNLKNMGSNNRKINHVKNSNKKSQKKDRTARKQTANDLVVNHLYDDDIQPEIPDFHQTPIKGRKMSENNYDPSAQDDFNRYSNSNKNKIHNKSDQRFTKKNGLNDLVLVSLESGDNYDQSLAEEFQRGNTLQPADKDELPPSNLYATQKLQKVQKKGASKIAQSVGINNRMVPNTLIGDDTEIQILESDGGDQSTIKGQLLDFNNEVSPSHFNQANMRIQNEQLSQAPTKPKITKKPAGQTKIGQVQNVDDEQDLEDGFDRQYDLPNSKMQRYQNNQGMLDYDDIIYQRKNDKRVKQLQKIYLQRQNVNRKVDPSKKRKNYSSQSYRKEQS